MRNITLFLIVILASNCYAKSNKILSGKVFDKENNRPIALALISSDPHGLNVLGFSDINGLFSISISDSLDYFYLSHLSYKTVCLSSNKTKLNIGLRREMFELDGIVVYSNSGIPALKMVKSVNERLGDNLRTSPYQAKGNYILNIYKEGNCKFYGEEVTDFYSSGYPKSGHSYYYSFVKEIRASNSILSKRMLQFPHLYPYVKSLDYNLCIIPFLYPDLYNFSIKSNDGNLYNIVYDLKEASKKNDIKNDMYDIKYFNLQKGEVCIDTLDWSIKSIKYTNSPSLSNDTSKTIIQNSIIFKRIDGGCVISKCERFITNYEKEIGKQKFYKNCIHEVYELSNFETNKLTIPEIETRFKCNVRVDKRFSSETYFLVPNYFNKCNFDSVYWSKEGRIINAKIIQDLEDFYKIPLGNQFAQNSNVLVNDGKFRNAIKKAEKSERKSIINYYKNFKTCVFKE